MAKMIFGERVISHRQNKQTGHHWLTIQTPTVPGAGLMCDFEEAGWALAFPPIPRPAGAYVAGYSLTFKSLDDSPQLTFEEELTHAAK